MVSIGETRKAERAKGPATVMTIGTANPPNCVDQSTYTLITTSESPTTSTRLSSRRNSRSFEVCYTNLSRLSLRYGPDRITTSSKEVATKAIEEWANPSLRSLRSPHLLCHRRHRHALRRLPDDQAPRPPPLRQALHDVPAGCFAGGTVLRLDKDLAENNKGARALVVCSEITTAGFRIPSETHLESLVGTAIFGDGAATIIVGADPLPVEKPLFELFWTAQTILPDSEGAIEGHLRQAGLTFHLLKQS